MRNKVLLALAAAGMATSASAAVNILVNPSFEMGVGVDSFKSDGSTDITGWEVEARIPGTVSGFYASNATWDAFDGTRSYELNGNTQGAIFQDVILEVGKQYKFSFAYSVDPNGTRASTPFTASIRSANTVQTYVRPVGHSATNMQYEVAEIVFTATNKFNRVSFDSGNGGQFAPVIDGISLSLVPEPATWALLIAGFGMVGFSMRRRRTSLTSVAN